MSAPTSRGPRRGTGPRSPAPSSRSRRTAPPRARARREPGRCSRTRSPCRPAPRAGCCAARTGPPRRAAPGASTSACPCSGRAGPACRWLKVPRSVSWPVSRTGTPSASREANASASACAQSIPRPSSKLVAAALEERPQLAVHLEAVGHAQQLLVERAERGLGERGARLAAHGPVELVLAGLGGRADRALELLVGVGHRLVGGRGDRLGVLGVHRPLATGASRRRAFAPAGGP